MDTNPHSQLRIILFLENDPVQAGMIKRYLESQGCWVLDCTRYDRAVGWIYENRSRRPDAIVIDVPDKPLQGNFDAFKLYRFVRSGGLLSGRAEHFRGWNVPIVMLVKNKDFDAVTLEMIEKYEIHPHGIVPKPFELPMLYNQLKGLQWHAQSAPTLDEEPVISIGSLTIYRNYRLVMVDSKIIDLASLEYDFLEFFALNRLSKRLFTNHEILKNVWRNEKPTQSELQYAAIYKHQLKDKFAGTSYKEPVRNMYGQGYYFYTPEYTPGKTQSGKSNQTEPKAKLLEPTQFASGYLFLVDGDEEHTYLMDASGVLPLGNPGSAGIKIGRGYEPDEQDRVDVELVIDSYEKRRVSRLHATVLENNGQYGIRDENSRGGTEIIRETRNGTIRISVKGDEIITLVHKDIVCFNVIKYRFEIR